MKNIIFLFFPISLLTATLAYAETPVIPFKGPIITVINETRYLGCNPDKIPACADPRYDDIRETGDDLDFSFHAGIHRGMSDVSWAVLVAVDNAFLLNLSVMRAFDWEFYSEKTYINTDNIQAGSSCSETLGSKIDSYLNQRAPTHIFIYVSFAEKEHPYNSYNEVVTDCRVELQDNLFIPDNEVQL
jgi:hypothetical protein